MDGIFLDCFVGVIYRLVVVIGGSRRGGFVVGRRGLGMGGVNEMGVRVVGG